MHVAYNCVAYKRDKLLFRKLSIWVCFKTGRVNKWDFTVLILQTQVPNSRIQKLTDICFTGNGGKRMKFERILLLNWCFYESYKRF